MNTKRDPSRAGNSGKREHPGFAPTLRPSTLEGCWRHFWSEQENSTSDVAAEHVLDSPRPSSLQPPRASALRKKALFSAQGDSGFLRLLGRWTWACKCSQYELMLC